MKPLNFEPFPKLITDRLVLREMKTSDKWAIFEYRADPDNFPYIDMPVYESVEEVSQYLVNMKDGVTNNKWIAWAICIKETDEIIGTISLWNFDLKSEKGEAGFGLFPGFRHNGYMEESLQAVMEYGFRALSMKTIEAYIGEHNTPAIQVVKKLDYEEINSIEEKSLNGNMVTMKVFEKRKS